MVNSEAKVTSDDGAPRGKSNCMSISKSFVISDTSPSTDTPRYALHDYYARIIIIRLNLHHSPKCTLLEPTHHLQPRIPLHHHYHHISTPRRQQQNHISPTNRPYRAPTDNKPILQFNPKMSFRSRGTCHKRYNRSHNKSQTNSKAQDHVRSRRF